MDIEHVFYVDVIDLPAKAIGKSQLLRKVAFTQSRQCIPHGLVHPRLQISVIFIDIIYRANPPFKGHRHVLAICRHKNDLRPFIPFLNFSCQINSIVIVVQFDV